MFFFFFFLRVYLENNILSFYPLKQTSLSGVDAELKKDMSRSFCFTIYEGKKMVLKKNSFGFCAYWIENENDIVTEMITSFICLSRILDERK